MSIGLTLPVDKATLALRAMEESEDFVLAVEHDWRVVYLNGAAERLLERDRLAVLGRELWEVTASWFRDGLESDCRTAMEQGHQHRVYADHPLGHRFEAQIFPTDTGLTLRLRDVGVPHASVLLEPRDAHFARVFADSPFPQLIVDPQSRRILTANRAARERYGHSVEEFAGMRLDAIAAPAAPGSPEPPLPLGRDVRRHWMRHAARAGGVFDVEVTTVAVTCRGRPARLVAARPADADPALSTLDDAAIGLALVADRECEAAERAARERDEVLGLLTHHLKDPLHTIGVVLSVLQDLPHSEEERAKRLDVIGDMTAIMERLISGLLDLRRIEAGQPIVVSPRPLAAQALIGESVALFASQIEEKQIRFAHRVEPGCPEVLADRDRMQQVLLNLIGNAVKYTPTAGDISVTCRREGTDRVRITVADSGPGIPEEYLDRLFDPFWAEKRDARLAAGLGLPIARGIVEAHGGRVEVENAPGRGATFSVLLPIARPI